MKGKPQEDCERIYGLKYIVANRMDKRRKRENSGVVLNMETFSPSTFDFARNCPS
jgi:hypothetical protein